MKKGLIPRMLITLLGIGLVFMGASEAILGFAGKSASAVITDIRREGGNVRMVIRAVYLQYQLHFHPPRWKKINGFTKRLEIQST